MSDLTAVCKLDDMSGTAVVESSTKSLAFGNILAGGVIGAAVDMGTGSAYDYPSLITVPISVEGSFTSLKAPEPEADDSKKEEYPSTRRRR